MDLNLICIGIKIGVSLQCLVGHKDVTILEVKSVALRNFSMIILMYNYEWKRSLTTPRWLHNTCFVLLVIFTFGCVMSGMKWMPKETPEEV